MHRNRVKWTRFQSIKNKSIRLDFYTYKPSPIDSNFIHRNRVRWTWFLCIKTESSGLVFYRLKSSPLDLIYVFFFATRHSNVCLKKNLLSKNSLIPSHTTSPLKRKLFTELKKLSHSHTHSPPTLTVRSLKKIQSLSHSIPSRSQLRSLTLWFGSVVVRLSHSFPLCSSVAVTFFVAVAPPSRSVSVSAPVSHSHSRSVALPSASPSLCLQLLWTYISILLLLWFLSIFPYTFWSIAIHFFLFLLSAGTTGFAHKETVLLWFLSISDQLQFIFSCFYWVGTHTKKPSSKLSVSKLRKQVHWTRFSSLETESFELIF